MVGLFQGSTADLPRCSGSCSISFYCLVHSCKQAPALALALAVLSGRPPPLTPRPHVVPASCRFKNEEYPSYFQGLVSKS
jgi:hypothetical protein